MKRIVTPYRDSVLRAWFIFGPEKILAGIADALRLDPLPQHTLGILVEIPFVVFSELRVTHPDLDFRPYCLKKHGKQTIPLAIQDGGKLAEMARRK